MIIIKSISLYIYIYLSIYLSISLYLYISLSLYLFLIITLTFSERVKQTEATGDRFKEAKNINKSLMCLGNVIKALCDKAKGLQPHSR